MSSQANGNSKQQSGNTNAMKESSKNEKGKYRAHKTKSWSFNEAGFGFNNSYIQLRYDPDSKRIFYLDDKNKVVNNVETILNELTPPTMQEIKQKYHNIQDIEIQQKIYIEWCDMSSGQYYYFNLYYLFDYFQKPFIDTNKLFDKINVNNKDEEKEMQLTNNDKTNVETTEETNETRKNNDQFLYEFDESVSLMDKLNSNDILLISPIRTLLNRFSLMGSYNGHQLYLGPYPTKQFILDCDCAVLFNCTAKPNNKDILSIKIKDNKSVKEILFDVSKWRWTDEDNNNSKFNNGLKKKKSAMQILDENVDIIFDQLKTNNVLIHCLAGAHRSPFIVACFMVKYGYFKTALIAQGNKLSYNEIYKFLQNKRQIVQPLSYGERLEQYIAYLVRKMDWVDRQ